MGRNGRRLVSEQVTKTKVPGPVGVDNRGGYVTRKMSEEESSVKE